ncbi:3'-5' exonuclease-like [Macrosteles quadrilineatus]|uniref:3'-5' exonuclease-like n=1 Tax=Macrosteles quadrilineatus TaxID=74068 RepID=UPI0023E135BD|nr:3'-5' exonuclease-like [Macrosteles quadrilineatus]XP_054281443.1 3'-5' exonuclease-like [Macrosteles quadrilineatus]
MERPKETTTTNNKQLPAWMKSTSKLVKDRNASPSDSFLHEDRPFLKFKGKVRHSNKIGDCGYVCEAILEKLEGLKELVVGFDLEWPVQWTKGESQHKTALIQFSPSVGVCYIFQVTEWKKLPKVFIDFISHPKVRLVGVNIKADIWKLGRDFDISVANIVESNVIELKSLANQIFSTQEMWSLDRLVLYVLKKQLDKSDVRTSNWAQKTLTTHQLGYAATDAYASLLTYLRLKEIEEQNSKDNVAS